MNWRAPTLLTFLSPADVDGDRGLDWLWWTCPLSSSATAPSSRSRFQVTGDLILSVVDRVILATGVVASCRVVASGLGLVRLSACWPRAECDDGPVARTPLLMCRLKALGWAESWGRGKSEGLGVVGCVRAGRLAARRG